MHQAGLTCPPRPEEEKKGNTESSNVMSSSDEQKKEHVGCPDQKRHERNVLHRSAHYAPTSPLGLTRAGAPFCIKKDVQYTKSIT